MGKKYVPNGYQIINLEISADDVTKLVKNKDYYILKDIITEYSSGKKFVPKKPILLTVWHGGLLLSLSGFALWDENQLTLLGTNARFNVNQAMEMEYVEL